MKYMITGISFVDKGEVMAGDLFQTEGGAWVFNGNVDFTRNGVEPRWRSVKGGHVYTRQFTATDYWERHGVFVFEPHEVTFNDAARSYLAAWSAQ